MESKFFLFPGETEDDLVDVPAFEEVVVDEDPEVSLSLYRTYLGMGGKPYEPMATKLRTREAEVAAAHHEPD